MADAVSVPVGVVTVARTSPWPDRLPAVNVTVGPVAGDSVPGAPGESAHVACTGNWFPS